MPMSMGTPPYWPENGWIAGLYGSSQYEMAQDSLGTDMFRVRAQLVAMLFCLPDPQQTVELLIELFRAQRFSLIC